MCVYPVPFIARSMFKFQNSWSFHHHRGDAVVIVGCCSSFVKEDFHVSSSLVLYWNGGLLLHVSQTRTSVSHPRSATGRLVCEQPSHTAWPHDRQWWRFRSPIFNAASKASIDKPEPLFCDDEGDDPDFLPFDASSSAVPNGFVHTQQKFASRSLSGTQYDGRAESLIRSARDSIREKTLK